MDMPKRETAPHTDTAPDRVFSAPLPQIAAAAAPPQRGQAVTVDVLAAPPAPPSTDEASARVIGEALGLYIVAEKGDALILIDKHAAHERIIFDALQKNGAAAMSQTLLQPVTFNTGSEDAELLSQNGELLSELGFELEPYGAVAFILRAAPCGIDPFDACAAVEEILDSLKKNLRPDPRAARDEALKTVACKAAIKAGRRSEPAEIQKLAEAVCSGEVRYCPHGRPVAWTLDRTALDKAFKRIV
jgi:DNA mismatch repair protein MutL